MVSLRKRPHSGTEQTAHQTSASRPSNSVETTPTERKSPEAKPQPAGPLQRLRNNWYFANLCQWIYLFGQAVKIPDEIDVDVLEAECLKQRSIVLLDVGLCLLKYLSSHRGLNHELFDEYTRRQYLQKLPEKNPFGKDQVAKSFHEFDIDTKLRILHQMTQWTMINSEKLRDRMTGLKDTDHTGWRIEPYGWDSEDRSYYVLDDNRLYRMTDAPESTPPPSKSKKSHKSLRPGGRSSKRRRVGQATGVDSADAEEEDAASESISDDAAQPVDDGLGGAKWECIAVGYSEVMSFLATLQKTKDENEKILRDQIKCHLLPILEKQENSHKRKQQQRNKELENLSKMANAKRSSRLAVKQEQKTMEENAKEKERIQHENQAKARKEEQIMLKREKERDQRLRARERRMKDRESRKLLHKQELARLSSQPTEAAAGQRLSGRRLQAEIERQKEALAALENEEDWMFDCICGMHGQVDDGTHCLACERCSVWLHSKCVGVDHQDAEHPDFHFICASCKRRMEDEQKKVQTVAEPDVGPSNVTDGDALSQTDSMPIPGPKDTASARSLKTNKDGESLAAAIEDDPSRATPSSPSPCSSPGVPPSPSKKSVPLPLSASRNSNTPGSVNGFASTLFATRQLHDRAGESNCVLSVRPETPTEKACAKMSDAHGMATPQRFMNTTPTSRRLSTPSGNGVFAPPGRRSMSFLDSFHANLNSSPLGKPADLDNPSSPIPPAEAGISPLKNTPARPRTQKGLLASLKAAASIQPPTVLAPVQGEVILTPPVKMTEEQRRHSRLQQRLSSPLVERRLNKEGGEGKTQDEGVEKEIAA
ncbi:hypothetical protein Cpir12675_003449 [Ceratocystis pirilliformis]|uniref:Zinc finger PHD-type domain-containing protein n=1 Tax=Ceratocystis pirilliformis TaxID=259994 RepID=A0ABR3Z4L6_9PEZI